MKDLLPCPFCGGEANTVLKGADDWHIECHDCASRSGIYGIKESAIAAWNTRAERTCHNDGGTDENGQQVFNCSNCKCVLSLFDSEGFNTICTSHIYDYPRYCPNCGARVKEES